MKIHFIVLLEALVGSHPNCFSIIYCFPVKTPLIFMALWLGNKISTTTPGNLLKDGIHSFLMASTHTNNFVGFKHLHPKIITIIAADDNFVT